MNPAPQQLGRRERNKQEKLDRIVAAAGSLFAARGVDEVTTQQIAEAADIGTGTLFLYARTKGELLLLVQNVHYAQALEAGVADAESEPVILDAVMAILRPIVVCNRAQIDNGRTYLREMVFGDPLEPHHAAALAIVAQTEEAVAAVLDRDPARGLHAPSLAQIVSAITFLQLSASVNAASSVEALVAAIREQVHVLLDR